MGAWSALQTEAVPIQSDTDIKGLEKVEVFQDSSYFSAACMQTSTPTAHWNARDADEIWD